MVWDRVHCSHQGTELDQGGGGGGGGDEPALNDSTTDLHQQLPSQQHAGGAAPVSLAVGEPQASTSQAQQDSDKQKVPPAAGLSEKKEDSVDRAPHKQVHR